jgi:hypothetical protein
MMMLLLLLLMMMLMMLILEAVVSSHTLSFLSLSSLCIHTSKSQQKRLEARQSSRT